MQFTLFLNAIKSDVCERTLNYIHLIKTDMYDSYILYGKAAVSMNIYIYIYICLMGGAKRICNVRN
jgi:hypothetical protein